MLNETWLAVKTTVTGRVRVKLIFGSPHAIRNNYRHISCRLKSNLKCFVIGKIHCVERWRSKWIITRYEQRSYVVTSFFASTYTFDGPCPAFLGINGPSMMRSFPLLQESSELWFRFCLHDSAQNVCQKWTFAAPLDIYLLSGDKFKMQTGFSLFLATRYCQFSFKIFACNHFGTE